MKNHNLSTLSSAVRVSTLDYTYPSIETWKESIQFLCQQGKTQIVSALKFHLAEDLRVHRKDWENSYPLYKSLLRDYLDDNDRRRALFMITELMIARHNEVQSISESDRWLTKLCNFFTENSFLVPIGSDDWNKFMIYNRFHKALFVLALQALHTSQLFFEEQKRQNIADGWIRWVVLTESPEWLLQSLSSCWPFERKSQQEVLLLLSRQSCLVTRSIDSFEQKKCMQIIERMASIC